MCCDEERVWWPLDLSDKETEAVRFMEARLESHAPTHDVALARAAVELLDVALQENLTDILTLDTLPNYCHLLNGWGNAKLGERCLLDGLSRYVHRTPEGVPHILQCEDEGDFHPWQSLAYAVMAGVSPDAMVTGADCTLMELAEGSRLLNTDDGCELGHLLYTAAHLGLHASTQFGLRSRLASLAELTELAVDAHRYGHFKVCRKVHLTEGLCAISAMNPELSHHRGVAQGFLSGQLDLLPVLAAAISGASAARDAGTELGEGSVVEALRSSLVIESFIENHYYLAGHLIELAALAHGFGFEVSPKHWAAARFVVDQLNRLLPEYLPRVSLPGCFLHFGHYRRAVTLLHELSAGGTLDEASRARFTTDLRARRRAPRRVAPAPADDGVFTVDRRQRCMGPALSAVVLAFEELSGDTAELSGNCAHFRRLLVSGWPRWLHFEFLDYSSTEVSPASEGGIGVELHVECPSNAELVACLDRIAAALDGDPELPQVESNLAWSADWRRLRMRFDDAAEPMTIARTMQRLVRLAVPLLTPKVNQLFPRSATDDGALVRGRRGVATAS